MNRRIKLILIVLFSVVLVGCNTIRGTVMGAGIGYVLGDAEMGAAVGATAGAVVDIWGR